MLTPLPDMRVRAVDGDPSQTSMTVITLLWRNERYAHAFLRTLETAAAAADTSVELVAVENGPDGTLAGLALAGAAADAEHIRMLLCRSPDNAGFSGGSNRGCAVASGDILVVANLDLEFDPAFVVEVKARAAALSEPAFLVPSVALPRMNGRASMAGRCVGTGSIGPPSWLRRRRPANGFHPRTAVASFLGDPSMRGAARRWAGCLTPNTTRTTRTSTCSGGRSGRTSLRGGPRTSKCSTIKVARSAGSTCFAIDQPTCAPV